MNSQNLLKCIKSHFGKPTTFLNGKFMKPFSFQPTINKGFKLNILENLEIIKLKSWGLLLNDKLIKIILHF